MKLSVSLFILFYILPSDGAETGRDLSSLTFVIDITPSMMVDIDEVRRDVYEIFETVYNHNASQIYNFILVTFKDEGPDNAYRCNSGASVAVRAKTRDRETFKTALFGITVESGFPFCEDCPMSGIKRAIEESLPRSMIYVFTDATAKDYYMYEEVKNMAQAKGCQIVYALTGQCSEPETSPKYKVYTDSAEATGGRVFKVNKGEINKVLSYMKKTITGRRTTPIDKSLTPGVHSIPFITDSLMGEVILSFTSSVPNDPIVNVKAPDGTTVPKSVVMHSAKAQVYSFNVTKFGIHTLEVNTGAVTRAEVSAESGVDFKHGFSAYQLSSIVDTSTRPTPGAKSYLSINLNEGDITLKSVQILDLDDNLMLKLPLVLSNNATDFYTTEAFDPPTTPFRIAIVGCTAAKECNIIRKEPSPVEVDSSLPGSVTNKAASITELETKINVNYSEPVQIICKVNAYPKPKITWTHKETANIFVNKTLPGTTYPYDHVNILYIESATENASYVCEAKNTMGSSSKEVIVEVAPK